MPTPLEFGWFLPTSGDTTCYGDRDAFIEPSAALFDRVILAAEAAGFEYFLVPVASTCWEAWISSAMAVAKTKRIKALVAARPGYVNPVQLAKMGADLRPALGRAPLGEPDRRAVRRGSGGGRDHPGEGGPLRADGGGRLHHEGAVVRPRRRSTSTARFHTLRARGCIRARSSGRIRASTSAAGRGQAWEISAQHSDVHLFWGDTPERIAEQHGRDPRAGRPARAGGDDRLRDAPADHLPRDRGRGLGSGA